MQNSVTLCFKQVDPNLYYETTHSSILNKLRSNKVITCIKEFIFVMSEGVVMLSIY